MIHIPTRLPPKKTRSRKQTPEDASTSETQRLVHEIVNQLSVMNLCCFKFRAAQAYLPPASLADIDRMETPWPKLPRCWAILRNPKHQNRWTAHCPIRVSPNRHRSKPSRARCITFSNRLYSAKSTFACPGAGNKNAGSKKREPESAPFFLRCRRSLKTGI